MPNTEKTVLRSLEQPDGLPVPLDSSWGQMAVQGNFRDALPLIETDMANPGPDAPANDRIKYLEKLWWVRGQLATEGMPLAALTTPLSEIVRDLKDESSLRDLSCSTFYLLANQLAVRKQSRLATLFFDHTLELGERLSREERKALRAYAASVYRDEVARAELKREPANYVSKIKSRLEELEKVEVFEPSPVAKEIRLENKAAPLSLSAKSIRGADFSEKYDFAEKNFRDDEAPVASSATRAGRSESNSSKQTRGFLLGAVCVGILMFAWQVGFQGRHEDPLQVANLPATSPTVDAKSAPSAAPGGTANQTTSQRIPDQSIPGQAMPNPGQQANPASAFPTAGNAPTITGPTIAGEIKDHLKSIDANLDTLGERLKNVTFKGIDKTKSVEEISKDPEVDQNSLHPKEANNLPKPVPSPAAGSDELAALDGSAAHATPTFDPKKIPLLDPARAGQVTTSELEPANNPRSLEPAKKSDRDSVQPSLPNFGGPPDPKGRTLDGSPLRPYPVDRLSEPMVYRTITETEVLSAPSLLAQTITRLPVDTSVQVVSRVGQWLELRSIGGKRGFIYTQNAIPSPGEPADRTSQDHLD